MDPHDMYKEIYGIQPYDTIGNDNSNNNTNSETRLVHVGIVNDHNEIVPFFQSLLRAKKISLSGLHMIHFDSHPDLSVPSYTAPDLTLAQHWFNGQSLYYDVLSTDGKIAEFLLPMQYIKILRDIVWIKAPWSNQIDNGTYRFQLGHIDEKPYVNLDIPYYIDEGVVYHSSLGEDKNEKEKEKASGESPTLQDAVDLTLHVSTIHQCTPVLHDILNEGELKAERVPWCLDICLDYFACQNPFRIEIRTALCERLKKVNPMDLVRMISLFEVDLKKADGKGDSKGEVSSLLADKIMQNLTVLYSHLRFRHGNVNSRCWSHMQSKYPHIYSDRDEDGNRVNSGHQYAKRNRERCYSLAVLKELFLRKEPLQEREDLAIALEFLYMPSDDGSNGFMTEREGEMAKGGLLAIREFIRVHAVYLHILPLQTRTLIADTNFMLFLPYSNAPQYHMHAGTGNILLKQMEDALLNIKASYPHSWPPECITIARSSEGRVTRGKKDGKDDGDKDGKDDGKKDGKDDGDKDGKDDGDKDGKDDGDKDGKDDGSFAPSAVVDGSFTPSAVVDTIEKNVLAMLKEVFGSAVGGTRSSRRKRGRDESEMAAQLVIHRLHDPINGIQDGKEEEEDAYTRAYRLFLPDAVQSLVSFSERDK